MKLSGGGAALGTFVVFGAAAAGWWWFGGEREGSETGPDSTAAFGSVDVESGQLTANAPQPVVGAEVVLDTLWIEVETSGRSQAFRRVELRAQADGIAMEVPARENRLVRAGDLLLAIDTIEYALEVTQARSELLRAEADYRQMTIGDDLVDDPTLREERERNALARSGLEQARVSLAQALRRLDRTRLLAPFDGLLADLKVVEGQWVSTGADVVTVLEPHPIKVEAQVLEGNIGRVAEGREAEVSFAAYPGESFAGKVATINPVVDPDLRTGRVTILVPNPDLRIKAGMYADVSLMAEALPDRVIVPKAALLERGEGIRRFVLFVYRPREGGTGIAERLYVNPGRESRTQVELLAEGPETGMVAPGEIVLVEGHHYLGDRVPVVLTESTTSSGGSR